mmetsp:Transcript_69530/g.96513  ORF Transcript_69530/g.96513 Transcript_69530/m.96513 type:complete len:226 (-) Transcript_69530:3431-4108(-)
MTTVLKRKKWVRVTSLWQLNLGKELLITLFHQLMWPTREMVRLLMPPLSLTTCMATAAMMLVTTSDTLLMANWCTMLPVLASSWTSIRINNSSSWNTKMTFTASPLTPLASTLPQVKSAQNHCFAFGMSPPWSVLLDSMLLLRRVSKPLHSHMMENCLLLLHLMMSTKLLCGNGKISPKTANQSSLWLMVKVPRPISCPLGSTLPMIKLLPLVLRRFNSLPLPMV